MPSISPFSATWRTDIAKLIKRAFGNGNLEQIGALTRTANQVLYTDASANFSFSPITPYARTILDDPDASTALSTLGASAFGKALIALTGTNGNIPVMSGTGTVASRPIVGTVSQSGGVPTGAIIEWGSNVNGYYVRFADGTQICWVQSQSARTITNSSQSIYRSDAISYTYPAAFSTIPVVAALNNGNVSGAAGVAWATWAPGAGGSLTGLTMYLYSTSNTSVSGFMYIAIGRWF